MSWLSSWLHPQKGYDKAQEQLNQYYNEAQGNLQPYNQNGQNAFGGINQAMQNLLNPQTLQDQWSKGYQESDLAKQNEAMASQHGLDAASSMGLMASSPAIQAIQSGTSGIVAADRQKYLDDLMQKYMTGIGIGQNVYNTGANSANALSQNAMNMGQNSAEMAYGKENSGGNMFNSLIANGAGLAASYLGGPLGAAAWSATGGKK